MPNIRDLSDKKKTKEKKTKKKKQKTRKIILIRKDEEKEGKQE